MTEDAPLDPRSVYAATKVHQEHLAFVPARGACRRRSDSATEAPPSLPPTDMIERAARPDIVENPDQDRLSFQGIALKSSSRA